MLHGNPPGLHLNPLFFLYKALWNGSDAAFAEVDAFAWTQEWRIERHLTRHVYRDRLFDSLVQCSACHGGIAADAARECRVCSGTGHLILLDMPKGEG
ncbi:hypothetical protein HNP84_007825 [Thermocatellispora tengchongensis]|uniref:Uncharacterized protein n=1 Tax=Thermocatellispora tengchongensis TaxID=1073253 RepID=A0A840PFZ2_9ACTN|nr:hypothetical protein [Thermocatellispora tengchongensis]MBB5138072.1 hypothetical protein [Thermocatellispora tengchongensis]